MRKKILSRKRILALLTSIVMVAGVFPVTASASDYAGHWAKSSIDKAVEQGWFAKNATDTYRPNDSITRAEFVTMVNRMKGYTGEADLSGFTDVRSSEWYYSAFAAAVAQGYIQGSDGKLNPTANITRNEAVVIFARISGLNTASAPALPAGVRDAAAIPDWAKPYAGASIAAGLIAGSDGAFAGSRNITRAETAVLLERLHDDVKVFAFAGTYGGVSAVGSMAAKSVIVQGADVTLKNMKVVGNLTIAESVGNGDVTLDTVTVGGELNVNGGGSESVKLTNCTIAKMMVTKNSVHIVLGNGTEVTEMIVDGRASSIEIDEGVTVKGLVVEDSAAGTEISLAKDATVDTLTVNGANTTVDTESGSKIGTLTADAPMKVTGTGTISTANINAADVALEQTPSTVKVDEDLTAVVGGQEVTGTTTNPSTGGGGEGSGGGGVSTTATFVASDLAGMTFVVITVKGPVPAKITVTGGGKSIEATKLGTGSEWRCVFDARVDHSSIKLSY